MSGYDDVYILLMYFIIFSFCGYLLETINIYIKDKRLVNRGFLFGPFCIIYGFGLIISYVLLYPFYENIVLLFLLSSIICTILEYCTILFTKKVYNKKYWDYHWRKFNFQGRVALLPSIYFGLLCAFIIRFMFNPIEQFIVYYIPFKFGFIFVILFFIYLSIDLFLTVKKIIIDNQNQKE